MGTSYIRRHQPFTPPRVTTNLLSKHAHTRSRNLLPILHELVNVQPARPSMRDY